MRCQDRSTNSYLTLVIWCSCISLLLTLPASSSAAEDLKGLRGLAPLDQEPKAPPMARVENTDVKRGRAYTSQPPTIPHAIEKYEITRNVNFCMYCHARVRNEEFGAPMVSATHYMDRDQNFLAEISPRRYFCTQCHVPQTNVKSPVSNTFVDVYDLIERERKLQQSKKPGDKKQP
jgi:cytochrome c-type protein NapB